MLQHNVYILRHKLIKYATVYHWEEASNEVDTYILSIPPWSSGHHELIHVYNIFHQSPIYWKSIL